MATKRKIRFDNGYLNAFMPTRGRMTNYSAEMMGGGYLLSQPVLQSSYIHNGFTRIVVDKPAEEMTRAGFDIVGLDESMQDTVYSRLEELNATHHITDAIKWRRAFGGGLIVLGINDNQNVDQPLNEDKVTGVEFMRVYDRFECTVHKRYDDPNKAEYGNIEFWQISPRTGVTSYLVHESRVLVFDGESIPNDIRISNDGWGASVTQSCFVQLARLDSAYKWSLLMLERMQQAVHSIPGLSQQIDTPEGEALVTKRVQIADSVRNSLNMIVIDGEEEYTVTSLTLSGINDIVDRFLRSLSAVSSVPAFLLGENITGMNTGSSNKEGWYAQVESWQNDQLRKPLDRLISLIILGESKGTTDGNEYTLEFKPLFTPTDSEIATNNKSEADTLVAYIGVGVMDVDEAREVIRAKFNLTGDAPEPEPEPDPVLDPITLKPGERLVPHPGAVKPPTPPANA